MVIETWKERQSPYTRKQVIFRQGHIFFRATSEGGGQGNRDPDFTLLPPSNLLQRLCVGLRMSQGQPEARSHWPVFRAEDRMQEHQSHTHSAHPTGDQKSLRKTPNSPSNRGLTSLSASNGMVLLKPSNPLRDFQTVPINVAGGRVPLNSYAPLWLPPLQSTHCLATPWLLSLVCIAQIQM